MHAYESCFGLDAASLQILRQVCPWAPLPPPACSPLPVPRRARCGDEQPPTHPGHHKRPGAFQGGVSQGKGGGQAGQPPTGWGWVSTCALATISFPAASLPRRVWAGSTPPNPCALLPALAPPCR